jgi:N-acetyl-alpha-D-muramate 1-phosphate uridylyltransferase
VFVAQKKKINFKNMKAMILAAGLGSRLKPWTDHHPKALAMVNGKSLLQRNIEYLQSYGITDVVVNVHHFADQIIDAIASNNGWGSQITISDETNEVLETGGGLWKAKELLQDSENFVLMNVDMLTDLDLQKMIAHHERYNGIATLAITNRNSSRVFLFSEANELCGWRNKINGEEKIMNNIIGLHEFAFSGFHIINTEIFEHISQRGKFGLVDVYLSLCSSQFIMGYNHSGGKLLDVGKPESIAQAELLFP